MKNYLISSGSKNQIIQAESPTQAIKTATEILQTKTLSIKTIKVLNTPQEIKEAINAGKTVYAGSSIYEVIKDNKGQYLIKCTLNDYCVGLTGQEGTPYENVLNSTENFYTV